MVQPQGSDEQNDFGFFVQAPSLLADKGPNEANIIFSVY